MIAIVDYEMGNLRSVQKAFEKVGHRAEVTSDPGVVAGADRIVGASTLTVAGAGTS